MNKRISTIILVMLIGATCLLSWNGLTIGHNWGGDFAAYIMQAQSILNGKPSEFIQTNRFAMENSTRTLGPIAYPWGFPVLLAPFYALFGLKMLALKSLNIICYLILLILLWLGFSRYHSRVWHIILVSLFALNPYFLRFLNKIISDIPFLLFSTLAVIFMGRVVIQRRRFISKVIDQLLLGILIAISFFIRTQGILILATLGITQFIMVVKNIIAQQKKAAAPITQPKHNLLRLFSKNLPDLWIFILPYLCFFILTFFWRMFLPEGGSSHISVAKHVSSGVIKHHLIYYFKLPFTGLKNVVGQTLYGASLPIFIVGMFKRRNFDYHIIIYGALTILVLIVWPGIQGRRYLFPIIPFYVSFVLTALESFHDNSDGMLNVFLRVVNVCSVIVIIVLFLRISIKDVSKNLAQQRVEKTGPYVSTSKDLFSFISNNTENDSIIVFFKPRVMRLFTNRQTVLIHQVDKVTRGNYLCLYLRGNDNHQIGKYDLASLLKDEKIKFLYQNMDFQLYRIIKP